MGLVSDKKPTMVQLKTLAYIAEFRKTYGFNPTIVDVANYFSIYRKAAESRVVLLERKGLVVYISNKHRALFLTDSGEKTLKEMQDAKS
jgi:Mn-dependent DtxR family transcriptional regulator